MLNYDRARKIFLHLLPLFILIVLMAAVYVFGFTDWLTYHNLQKHQREIQHFVQEHYILTPAGYFFLYVFAVALSIPGGSPLAIFAGYLFPQPWSTILVIVAETLGATLIFLVVKEALAPFFEKSKLPYIDKIERGFNENAWSYLLFMRFIPVFPFWLINIAPALLQVPTWTYIWTTVVGIIPISYVHTQAGRGIEQILAAGEKFSLETIFNTQVKIALGALAVAALVPTIIKYILKRRKKLP